MKTHSFAAPAGRDPNRLTDYLIGAVPESSKVFTNAAGEVEATADHLTVAFDDSVIVVQYADDVPEQAVTDSVTAWVALGADGEHPGNVAERNELVALSYGLVDKIDEAFTARGLAPLTPGERSGLSANVVNITSRGRY
jgi:hypothetical protein